jgi:TolB protein
VYVVYEGGVNKLVRSNISGGGKTYITRNPIGNSDTRPDLRENVLLCDTVINGRRQVVSLLDNGTEVTVLGEGHSPSWHPDEPRCVFIRNDGVFEMNLLTNQATQIYADTDSWCRLPSYSPDGRYILFQKETPVSITALSSTSRIGQNRELIRWHLFAIKTDGTSLSQITSGNVDVYSPSWGGAKIIYFISNAGGKTEIWRAQLNLN